MHYANVKPSLKALCRVQYYLPCTVHRTVLTALQFNSAVVTKLTVHNAYGNNIIPLCTVNEPEQFERSLPCLIWLTFLSNISHYVGLLLPPSEGFGLWVRPFFLRFGADLFHFCNPKNFEEKYILLDKLDGVGPVHNRPSTN